MAVSKQELLVGAFARHLDVVTKASQGEMLESVARGAEILLTAAKTGHRLLVCGNGGSAADSQHFATEWVCKYKDDRRPLPAIALTTDTSALTAIGNDYGFDEIFARQIRALGVTHDVLAAFTTSGSSKNILAAIRAAREKGMSVIVLTGEKGASLAAEADCAVIVPSLETARIQEVHELVYHAWCEYLDVYLSP